MIIPFAHGIYQHVVPRDEVQCTFVAVGHGSAVILQLPDGQTLLYDSGRLRFPQPAVDAVSHVLWHRRIRHLDAVIVSHADADHYNAIPELAERFPWALSTHRRMCCRMIRPELHCFGLEIPDTASR
ncbi:MAG: MBL fold metallo-hydrolase [Pirellulaceae bacterium]